MGSSSPAVSIADSIEFLQGSLELNPDSEYGYYTHYLAAKSLEKLTLYDQAIGHCRESVRLEPDFAAAADLMTKLSDEAKK